MSQTASFANSMAMFPGQGSQYVGMGKDLLEQFPESVKTFEEASDKLSLDLKRLCLEGPDEDLRRTENTQPCILTMSVALWRVIQKEAGFAPDFFAGHSLGEYSALVAGSVLDFNQAVFLVRKRGEAMQNATALGVGSMAAVMNFEAKDLIKLCQEVSTADSLVEVVNYNAPTQLVVAGHKIGVDKLCQRLGDDGIKSVPLNVSAPFHSSLMTRAKENMSGLLFETQLEDPPCSIIANLTGEIAKPYKVENLIEQIDHPVRWTQTMETAFSSGVRNYFEIGPGKVLFGLARRCLPRSSDDPPQMFHCEDLLSLIEKIKSLS